MCSSILSILSGKIMHQICQQHFNRGIFLSSKGLTPVLEGGVREVSGMHEGHEIDPLVLNAANLKNPFTTRT